MKGMNGSGSAGVYATKTTRSSRTRSGFTRCYKRSTPASRLVSPVFAASRSDAQHEVLRAIRSRAAVMALHCMAIMQLCACAVLPSTLLRAHVAALRPREAGKKDPAADAVAPSICRVYIGSILLRLSLVVLWMIGNTCHFLVLFDRFEPNSAQEWLACGLALHLP